jgi:glycosyltransferase involved in cell wall biosynthesis
VTRVPPLRVLIGYQVDQDYSLAQHPIVREVGARLDPERFHITAFYDREPDPRFRERPNTRLVHLPGRLRSAARMRYLASGLDRCWYLAPEPSTYAYLCVRPRHNLAVTSVEGHLWSDAFSTLSPAVKRYLHTLITRSRRLTAVNEEVASALLARFGRKADVVPVGVDTDLFHPRVGPAPQLTTVLFVGTLQPWKRPHLVLEAAARFPGSSFMLAGQGPLRGELDRTVAERALRNVRIIPPISHTELAALYREASVFLLPSRSEGSPKVLLEAAASGIPSVTYGGYRPEAVEDGRTGFVTNSEAAMMDALGRLLGDPALRRTFGENARQRAMRSGWDTVAARWTDVLAAPLPKARP